MMPHGRGGTRPCEQLEGKLQPRYGFTQEQIRKTLK
jgi:hypothetical protein